MLSFIKPPPLRAEPRPPQRVAVLGAGIVGLSTAWQLQRDGFEVTVIDRAQPGQGASAANGAQLSYAYVQPLADPSIWAQLPRLMLAPDSPFSLRLRLDPAQWAWGLRFLAACRSSVSAQTTEQLLALAARSRSAMETLLGDLDTDCQFSASGKLVMYASEAAFASARRQLALQTRLGAPAQQALSVAECLAVEPALAGGTRRFVGGIHTPSECTADCARVVEALHRTLSKRGVRFVLGQTVRDLVRRGDHIHAVRTDQALIDTDAVVVALGTGVAAFARRLGLRVPVYPLKGYSLTVDLPPASAQVPRVSVTDAGHKLVFARLGDRLRVAGMAELVGDDLSIDARRVEQLREAAASVFPAIGLSQNLQPWVGLRPATPDGRPLLGALPGAPRQLLFNTGHGGLGFTLAAGSALHIAELLHARAPLALRPLAARPGSCSA